MDQSDFKDEKTGLCKCFEDKRGRQLVINTEDPMLFEHYNIKPCFKGNQYAEYCEYCARETCLYYRPEVNLVPEGQEKTIILTKDEVERRKGQV